MQGRWQLGTILGIPFYLDRSWFAIAALLTWSNGALLNQLFFRQGSPWLGFLLGFVLALLLFASVLLHELGHSLVARYQGIRVNSITLFLFGGVAAIEREPATPEGALAVALAGPAVSLALWLVCQGGSWLPGAGVGQFMLADVGRLNLFLALFNLLPGLPLDGGQALKAIVWKLKGGSRNGQEARLTATRWAARSGQFFGALGIGAGLLLVFLAGEGSGLWLSLIGWFVWRNAQRYDQLSALQLILQTLTAGDAANRQFRVVSAELTLAEFAQTYLLDSAENWFTPYYCAGDGRYRGLVPVYLLRDIERSDWNWMTLGDIALPLAEIPSVTAKSPLTEAIALLESPTAQKFRFLTVLDPAGAVAGVIDRGDVMQALAQRANLALPEGEIRRLKQGGFYPEGIPLVQWAQMAAAETKKEERSLAPNPSP